MKSKRELVTRVLHGEDAGTIPVGLWHHFMEYKDMNSALTDPAVFAKNLAGQRAYKEAYPRCDSLRAGYPDERRQDAGFPFSRS